MSKRLRSDRADATWLVVIAASLWGLSALWRGPLAAQMPALAVVFWEHIVLVVLMSPWLPGAIRRVLQSSRRVKLSIAVIGAGSSALATTLFTAAFRIGDPITPQVLQKLQPLLALALAALILGEKLRPRFILFAVPALCGAWALTFAEPFDVTVASARPALLALGAAVLWAAGTVLGRVASAELRFSDVTALRFLVGLLTVGGLSLVTTTSLDLSPDSVPNIVLLALIPGLLALLLYYRALSRTPASRATLAELSFPLTAAVIGVIALGAELRQTQWAGAVVVLASVVALALHEHRSFTPSVTVSEGTITARVVRAQG